MARAGATGRIFVALLVAGLIALPAAAIAADRALGEYLSSECVTCHQLTGRYEGIPPIIGWPESSFIEIMNEYRTKHRRNQVMQTIAGVGAPVSLSISRT